MTLVQRPELPQVPAPSGDYGWGMAHLIAYREREQVLTEWRAKEAHAQALAVMERAEALAAAEARMAEAMHRRNARLRALDPDPPTVAIPREALDDAIGQADDDPEAPAPDLTPTGWPTELPTDGNALDRGERYVWWCLEQGRPAPTPGEVNRVVGVSNYIRKSHIDAWAYSWEDAR